eukprot:920910-Pleurochrysis_carterae.AAC.1
MIADEVRARAVAADAPLLCIARPPPSTPTSGCARSAVVSARQRGGARALAIIARMRFDEARFSGTPSSLLHAGGEAAASAAAHLQAAQGEASAIALPHHPPPPLSALASLAQPAHSHCPPTCAAQVASR